jgi:hypothetical protein
MKVMVFVKANKDSEAGAMPMREILQEMAEMLNPKASSMLMLVTAGTHRDQVVQYIVAEFASLHQVMYV